MAPGSDKSLRPPGGKRRGRVRIISGKWRGRPLSVASLPDLRPTPDRLKETLFNWLAPELPGAHCLDAFAGSGALGFESLSRGAVRATLIESRRRTWLGLRKNAADLQADQIDILHGDAHRLIVRGAADGLPGAPYQIAFLDPPYREGLPAILLTALSHLLASTAWIYIETSRHGPLPQVPASWQLHKTSAAGNAVGKLYRQMIAAVHPPL